MEGLTRYPAGILTGLVVVLVLFLAGCGGSSDDTTVASDEGATTAEASNGEATAQEPTEVSFPIPFSRGISWSPLVVADEEGYFADEGLEVEVEETNGSSFVTQQVIAGNTDYGWAGADAIIIAASRVPDLGVIMCKQSQNIFRIVTLETSDIQAVEDLAGRRLGFTEAGGGEEPLVNATVADAGLEDNVELVPIGDGGPQSMALIESGQVDAYAASYSDIAALLGAGMVFRDITPDKYSATPGDCLFGFKERLAEPEIADELERIGRAFVRGAVHTMVDTDGAIDVVCTAIPEACENRAAAEAFMAEAIRLYPPLDNSAPFGWSLSEEGWQTTADTLLETGTIGSEVDIDSLINDPVVTDIRDEIAEFGEAELAAQQGS